MIKHTLPQNHNHAVKRFPRTLYEAFPQYPEPTFDRTDTLVMGVCGVAALFLFFLLVMGY